jgi:hypothetical protein
MVPSGAFPDTPQAWTPPGHVVEYVLHGSAAPAGVHACPAEQAPAPHTPAVHTLPPPQAAPSVTLVPESAHAGVPLQVVAPVWHAFAGVQAVPGAQAAPTKPGVKWVTCAVATVPFTVVAKTSHWPALPDFPQ